MEIPARQKKALIIDLTAEIFRLGSAITPGASGTPKYPLSSRILSSLLDIIHRSQQISGPASHVVLAADADFGNLRKLIDPEYKANRANQQRESAVAGNPYDAEKQKYLFSEQGRHDVDRLKIILQQLGFPVVSARGHEGDDVIAWAHQALREQLGPDAPIEIYSPDKDMKVLLEDAKTSLKDLTIARRGTITGQDVATPWRKNSGIDAKFYSDHLALSGDRSDNIPGILSSPESMGLLNYIKSSDDDGYGFKSLEHFADSDPSKIDEQFQPHWFALNYGYNLGEWKKLLKQYTPSELRKTIDIDPQVGRARLAKNLDLAVLKPNITELNERYGNSSAFEAISRFLLPDKYTDPIHNIVKDLSAEARGHFQTMIQNAEVVGHGVAPSNSGKFFGLHPLVERSSFFSSGPIPDAISELDYRKKFEDSKTLFDTLALPQGGNASLLTSGAVHPFLVGSDKYRQYVPIVRIQNKDGSRHDLLSTEAGLFAREVGSPTVNEDGTLNHNKWIHAYGYDPSSGVLIHDLATSSDPYGNALGPSANGIKRVSAHFNDPDLPFLTAGQKSSGIYEVHSDTDAAKFFAKHLVPWHMPGISSVSARTKESTWENFFSQHRVLSREQALHNLGAAANTQQYMPEASRNLAEAYYASTGIHGGQSGPVAGAEVLPHGNFDIQRAFADKTPSEKYGLLHATPSLPNHTNINDYGKDLFDAENNPYDDAYLAAVIAATPDEAEQYRTTGIPNNRLTKGSLLMPLKQLKEHLARTEQQIANKDAYSVPELFSSHPALSGHTDATGARASELFIAHIEPHQAILRQRRALIPLNTPPSISTSHIAANIDFSPSSSVSIPQSVKLPSELHNVST